jgi:hypothetical protein
MTRMGKRLVLYKDRVWEKMAYRPNPIQKRVHASNARHRVNAAGRRGGKSVAGGRELTPRALQAWANRRMLEDLDIRMEVWIVGPNYTDSEKEFRVFYNDCRKREVPFDKPGTYYNPKGDMVISLWEGRFVVHAKSGAHPESLVGEGLHFALMAEAAKMKESVWHRFIRPTLADFGGGSLWNSTPEGKNWFYDIWQAGQGEDPDWESWRHPSWMNRFVFKKHTSPTAVEELLRLMRDGRAKVDRDVVRNMPIDPEIAAMAVDLTEATFRQEVMCSFEDQAGRVFKRWDEDLHVGDFPFRPDWPLYLATDYGYTDPNVCLFIQVDPHHNVYVIAEYYMRGRTDAEFAQDVMADPRLGSLLRHAKAIYPDPADPAASETLSQHWRVPVLGGTGGPLKDRRDLIETWLKVQNAHLPYGHPERVPKLRFDRSCRDGIFEMAAYRWPDRRKTQGNVEVPEDKDNHVPEALGRFFAGHYGGGRAPAQTSARVGRTRRPDQRVGARHR